MKKFIFLLSNVAKTMLLGSTIARFCICGCVIYLYGSVGSGKTVFCKGFLSALGYVGHVKSPTYTLVESYYFSDWNVHHFDFYRLFSSEELECIGIRDYLNSRDVCLIEWPKKEMRVLPIGDIVITIDYLTDVNGRKVTIGSVSNMGCKVLKLAMMHWNMCI